MSWRDAPLYIEANDLAVWAIARANSWPERSDRFLGPLVAQNACSLVSAVSLALTFPGTRERHLEEADHGIVQLRTALRLAHQLGLLSARGLRFAGGRLREIGKMVGGWRKRLQARQEKVMEDPF